MIKQKKKIVKQNRNMKIKKLNILNNKIIFE